MTADLLRSKPGHHADYQPAGDGSAQHQPPGMVLSPRGYQADGPALIEDQVGHQPDEPEQAPRRSRGQRADRHREGGHEQHPSINDEVCQPSAHDRTRKSSTISAVSRTN